MPFEINKSVFENFPELESKRLKYRQITVTDSEDLFKIRVNDDVMKYMDSHKMISVTESVKLIESMGESFEKAVGINWGLIEKFTNQFIGYFGYWRIDAKHCRAEIGYALYPETWGKGYMLEAFRTLIRFGFEKLNLHSIEANVNPGNAASIKLLEKFGFKREAYFRENYLFNNEFKDSAIYSLLESYINDNEI